MSGTQKGCPEEFDVAALDPLVLQLRVRALRVGDVLEGDEGLAAGLLLGVEAHRLGWHIVLCKHGKRLSH